MGLSYSSYLKCEQEITKNIVTVTGMHDHFKLVKIQSMCLYIKLALTLYFLKKITLLR